MLYHGVRRRGTYQSDESILGIQKVQLEVPTYNLARDQIRMRVQVTEECGPKIRISRIPIRNPVQIQIQIIIREVGP